jgi:hypothetical protein
MVAPIAMYKFVRSTGSSSCLGKAVEGNVAASAIYFLRSRDIVVSKCPSSARGFWRRGRSLFLGWLGGEMRTETYVDKQLRDRAPSYTDVQRWSHS